MIRKLCDVQSLPKEGQLKAFVDASSSTHTALCVGVVDGVPYAVENRCPHQRAPLAAGYLEGEYVVCPIHAWKFRLRDGKPEHPGDPVLPAYELRRYGDEIFVRLPSPQNLA